MRRARWPVPVLLVGMLLASPGALAIPGDILLASTSDAGTKANFGGAGASVSADGTVVAFDSLATNLDLADTDNRFDIYVKNLSTGDIVLASTSGAGTKGNGHSITASLSADGSRVAFDSVATNLAAGDTDTFRDIYVKDLVTGNIMLASTSDTGTKGNGDSVGPYLSADGTKVAFGSFATNLDPKDTDPLLHIYIKDLVTGDLTLVSTSDIGAIANSGSGLPISLSADAQRVSFTSFATNLDPADTDTLLDVYVKDLLTGNVMLASTSDTGVNSNGGSGGTSLSADGTRVAFGSSSTNLDPGDTDTFGDVYVKDLLTGDIVLASTSDTGIKGTGSPLGSFGPSLSADGTKVTFISSTTNLDPADTDTIRDVYFKDLSTGDIILASSSDVGTKANGDSGGTSLSADGASVAFDSKGNNLDPGDTDAQYDVYVKIVGTPPVRCTGLIATIAGTSGDDVLTGTAGDDVIAAGAGRDMVDGGSGNDTICAGPDDDSVDAGDGSDRVLAGGGDDSVRGGVGNDALRGGMGADLEFGGAGDDALSGGAGNDRLEGGPGIDFASGGPGTDICIAEALAGC